MFGKPKIGDLKSKMLAARLQKSAELVPEPQRSRILSRLPDTVFISHTSRDQELIGGPTDGRVLDVVSSVFPDPFLHNIGMGAAVEYEKVVGLALQASRRVLVVWSQQALQSDYVRAELLLAVDMAKEIMAYVPTTAPILPIGNALVVHDIIALRSGLSAWKAGA